MNNNSAKEIIKKTIFQNLNKPEKYSIFLFGSRVKWNYKYNSDYDIWIKKWNEKMDFIKYIRLKRKLDNLPYLIDLVDFNNVSKDFKSIANKHIEKWN